jgi:hypothetical protein
VIALIFGIAPIIAQSLPIAAPYIQVVLTTFTLFLGAAGSYDAIVGFKRTKAK